MVTHAATRPSSTSTQLHPTANSIPQQSRTQLCSLLNALLADCIDLTTQAKQAHWNLKGPNFIALHELFDELAKDSYKYSDLIAERAVQLGGQVFGTANAVAKASSLPEYPLDASAWNDHVAALTSSLAAFSAALRAGIEKSDKLGDPAATDIFTQVLRGVDKYMWFIESHAQP